RPGSRRGSRRRLRQMERERRASRPTRHVDGAAVRLHDLLRDPQAERGARAPLEDARELVGLKACTVVAQGELYLVALLCERELDGLAGPVLEGVREQ